MHGLQISLLGRVRVHKSDVAGELHLTRAMRALLAYLLLHRQRFHVRDVLAGLFWGESSQEHARSCLNTTLWRLRCLLESEGTVRGTYLIHTPQGEIGFNQESDYWLDVADFEQHTRRGLTQPTEALTTNLLNDLESSLELYQGDLMEGFYEDWVLRERLRLRGQYLDCLMRLMQIFGMRREFDESLSYGQKILDIEPLREETHCDMMRLYMANGQRVMAVQQYRLCAEVLAKELDISPLAETQKLYDQIVADTNPHSEISSTANSALDHAVGRLHQASKSLAEAQEQLRQAAEVVKDLSTKSSQ